MDGYDDGKSDAYCVLWEVEVRSGIYLVGSGDVDDVMMACGTDCCDARCGGKVQGACARAVWCMRGDVWTSGRQRDDDDDNDEQRCFLNVALDIIIIIIIFTALITLCRRRVCAD